MPIRPSSGVRTSATNELITAPNAAPMTTATARSITLPRMMNSRNSLITRASSCRWYSLTRRDRAGSIGLPGGRAAHRPAEEAPMRGDRVEIVVDSGQGGVRTFEISATRNGRRVEVTTARGVVEVSEVTRGGTPLRTGRFMTSRVIALVEHPALEGGERQVEVETTRRLGAGADG